METTRFYTAARAVAAPVLRALLRAQVRGTENIPMTGPVIIASNHLSFFDSIVLPVVAPRPITFLAKAEYFTGKGLVGALNRTFFTAAGTIPVDRDETRRQPSRSGLALDVLRRRRGVRHLPRGHPVPGRPALPRSDRHRTPRPRLRRPGRAGRAVPAPNGSSPSGPGSCAPRRCTSSSGSRSGCGRSTPNFPRARHVVRSPTR